ncbi:MAG: VCBS repeat-containing protein [Chloroflexaceae bacterium]|nr:VCBS repeat-containing protein [Chloroflexaceae bacterium]
MAVISRPMASERASVWGYRLLRWLKRGLLLKIGMYVLALAVLVLVAQQGSTYLQQQVDTMRYGFPRVAQITGYVGHGDAHQMPTHIMTLNMDGQISTLVIPGGDINRLSVLAGPYLVGMDGPFAVALPTLRDVNQDGHVDLLVTVRGETIVYLNQDGTFRLLTAEERVELQEVWSEP